MIKNFEVLHGFLPWTWCGIKLKIHEQDQFDSVMSLSTLVSKNFQGANSKWHIDEEYHYNQLEHHEILI